MRLRGGGCASSKQDDVLTSSAVALQVSDATNAAEKASPVPVPVVSKPEAMPAPVDQQQQQAQKSFAEKAAMINLAMQQRNGMQPRAVTKTQSASALDDGKNDTLNSRSARSASNVTDTRRLEFATLDRPDGPRRRPATKRGSAHARGAA